MTTNSGRVGLRSASSPRSSVRSNSVCHFVLHDLINLVKWNINGGRLTSAQLELHISAIEKRWLKRPEGQIHNGLGGGKLSNKSSNNSMQSRTRDSKHLSTNLARKGTLGSVSYPVYYAAAPLPLFLNLDKSKFAIIGEFKTFKFFLKTNLDFGKNI